MTRQEHYAARLRRWETPAGRRAAVVAMLETATDDHFPTDAETAGRVRAMVAALRQVEGRER